MEVKMLYFGMIEEKTGKNSEVFHFNSSLKISEIIHQIIDEYPSLQNITFRVSLDKDIVDEETRVTKDSELALLPPFAGG